MGMVNMAHIIPIMHCFDDRYVAPAAVAFLSMLEHASKDWQYKLYVVHEDITLEHQGMLRDVVKRFPNATLEFVNGGGPETDLFEQLRTQGHYSKEIIHKLTAARLFPQYDRLVITDVDVVYEDDIVPTYVQSIEDDESWLFGISCSHEGLTCARLQSASFDVYRDAGFSVVEAQKIADGVGAGYLIVNLRKMRELGLVERMLETFSRHLDRLCQPEQDVLNLVCAGHIHYLPVRNMVCSYLYQYLTESERRGWEETLAHPVQLHYAASKKPWTSPGSEMSHLWWGYLSRTPFFYEVASRFDLDEKKSICKLGGIRIAKIWHTGSLNKVCLVNSVKAQIKSL